MESIEYKNIKIILDNMSCYVDSKEIKLTKIEYKLLVFLLSNINKVFSRAELSLEVWSKKLTGRTVDTTVSRLRKKLGINCIKTKPGFGYGCLE